MKNKSIVIVVILLFSSLLLSGCTDTNNSNQYLPQQKQEDTNRVSNYISVKYRNTPVDINHQRWEKLNTSKSSFVNGAWYDSQNKYMIINLSGTNYHYCGLPSSIWSSFKSASSFGTYFNSKIKGNYDCRINPVPDY